jgi:anti-sigma factor RsiW
MKVVRAGVLCAVLLVTSACFRQVVQTGRTPAATVIDRPWTHTWLWGLVPASPIDVTSQCRSGIATVVTEQSFMNGLVGLLTIGIYSPRHVTITCATGSAMVPGARNTRLVEVR